MSMVDVYADLVDAYYDNPVDFSIDICGFYPDDWQSETMMNVALHPKTAVRSGQGVGKTGVESVLIKWFMATRDNPIVVCTAPTRQQLNEVLWAELAKWHEQSLLKLFFKWTKTRYYMVGHEERWYATTKTATKPENMQGFHREHMLFIVDEAPGIKDDILEAILGTLSDEAGDNKLLMCGNPNKTYGIFHDAFHTDREFYRTQKVSSMDSKRTNKDNINMLVKKYGWESDVVRVRVRGEFPKQSDPDIFIPLDLAENAVQHDILEYKDNRPVYDGELHIGADIAQFGDDEIVFYYRIGGYVFEPIVYRDQSIPDTAGKLIQLGKDLMKQYRKTAVAIKIDNGGLGRGVTDLVIRESKDLQGIWNILPVEFGGAGDEECDDEATIMMKNVRDELQEEHIQLPNDPETIAQLTTRKYSITLKGKFKIESKKEYKKRHGFSPDRADALMLCLKPAPINKGLIGRTNKKGYAHGVRKGKF